MTDVKQWNESRVCGWLQDSGLGHLQTVFKKNGVDGATLVSLTKTDLREELRIDALKDRKELWTAIENLQKSAPTSPSARTTVTPVPILKTATATPEPPRVSPRGVSPRVSPRYQSEYNGSFGKNQGVPIAGVSPRSPKPPTVTKHVTISDSDPRSCEYCFKPFGKGTDRIVLTLPGEDKGAHLHEGCKDEWTKENAKACEHCGELMTTGIVTVTLPGANRGADLHVACKESWLIQNAKRCDHCHELMTTDIVTISGGFGEACVHEGCCDAFEAEIKKRPKKTLAPAPRGPTVLSPRKSTSPQISPKAGVKCAECGVKISNEPMVNLTGAWGIANVHTKCATEFEKKRKNAQFTPTASGGGGRCDHCLKRFMAKDAPIMVTIPGTCRMVEMHPACQAKWSKINAPKCDNCGKPMVTEIITLSGSFGKAECHKECVNDYEKKIRVNGGRKP